MIGPPLPPHLRKSSTVVDKPSSSTSTSYGPQLPPHLQRSSSSSHAKPDRSLDDVVLGPMPLPQSSQNTDSTEATEIEARKREIDERFRRTVDDAEVKANQKSERGEWMLIPPSAGAIGVPINGPMKSRSFNPRTQTTELDPKWVESPAQRNERLRKEFSEKGSKRKRPQLEDTVSGSDRDKHMAESVAQYNATHRTDTLLSIYNKEELPAKVISKEHSASSRPFDREKDVLGRRPLDSKKRRELIDQSRNFSDKFGHGKNGAYL